MTSEVLTQVLAMTLAKVRKEIVEPLQARVAELESRPTMKYAGVWKAGETYPEGCFVTYDGSLWHAQQTTTEKPGSAKHYWRLAVKRGRDGKDANGNEKKRIKTATRGNGEVSNHARR